jgi:hypothetical protein
MPSRSMSCSIKKVNCPHISVAWSIASVVFEPVAAHYVQRLQYECPVCGDTMVQWAGVSLASSCAKTGETNICPASPGNQASVLPVEVKPPCLLWVKSGHMQCNTSCLLYPQ